MLKRSLGEFLASCMLYTEGIFCSANNANAAHECKPHNDSVHVDVAAQKSSPQQTARNELQEELKRREVLGTPA